MGRKSVAISINGKYKVLFLSEFTESKMTIKDFLLKIANEFIENENLNMNKIELPELKKGKRSYGRTEEEKKEAKREAQQRYYEKKKNDEEFKKKCVDRAHDWQKKNRHRINMSLSQSHYDAIEEIIKPTGYTVSQLFKLAIQEYLDENYVEESEESLESENAGD